MTHERPRTRTADADEGHSGQTDGDFPGTPRFTVLRRLGQGGFGVVYEVLDRARNTRMALKTLRRIQGQAHERFKQEFRSLADVHDAHLVALDELHADGDVLFFTMELVEGYNFLDYVWRTQAQLSPSEAAALAGADTAPAAAAQSHTWTSEGPTPTAAAAAAGGQPGPSTSWPPLPAFGLDLDRLRLGLQQLVRGLSALHRAHKLHRDIKPSNVLVTHEGRLVILDFGLVTDSDPAGVRADIEGTPGYMAPEQWRRLPLDERCDWYAVGALLHEALTGRTPSSAQGVAAHEIRDRARQALDHPGEGELAALEDLVSLCCALLRERPEDRPRGPEILRLTAGEAAAPTEGLAVTETFVGRTDVLAALEGAWAAMSAGTGAVVIRLQGPSGMGKSTLLRHFLEQVRRRQPDAVVLTGRCYERESVPYKALDSLVDALARHLAGLPQAVRARCLPKDAASLGKLFPVLRSLVPPDAGERVLQIPDAGELRRRAFAAFRELWVRLGQLRPVLLALDDVQWGDPDSAALLLELFAPPSPPHLLCLICHRSEEVANSPFLTRFLPAWERLPGAPGALDRRELFLERLSEEQAHDLAGRLWPPERSPSPDLAQAIAREAAGNPFFIRQLVEHALAQPPGASPLTVNLRQVIEGRLAALPEEARGLLETVAVSGRPLPEPIAMEAAGVAATSRAPLLRLRASHLVSERITDAEHLVETLHDRIRQAVVERLPEATRRHRHLQLALTLERRRRDPQTLVEHFREAGEPVRARGYAIEGAEQAAAALAFERAAALYRVALDLGAEATKPAGAVQATDDRPFLQERLGEALGNAGRCGESGAAFVAAAEELRRGQGEAGRILGLEQRAADQFLRAGRIEEGLALLRAALLAAGLRYPESSRAALLGLLKERAWLAVRGLGFRLREEHEVPAEDRARYDLYWAAAVGHGLVDPMRSGLFQSQVTRLGLRLGERRRLVRALGVEACYVASIGGTANWRRSQFLREKVFDLARQAGDPYSLAYADSVAGISALFAGDLPAAATHCDQAVRRYREECRGVTWEIVLNTSFCHTALAYLGCYQELAQRAPVALREIDAKGDVFGSTTLRVGIHNQIWLVLDRPDEAERQAAQGMEQWTGQSGFHSQHYMEFTGGQDLLLYRGDPWAAWARLLEYWPRMKAAFLLTRAAVRVELYYYRGRCALAAAGAAHARPAAAQTPPPPHERLLTEVRHSVKALRKEKLGYAPAFAAALSAGLAGLEGRAEEATHFLRQAADGFGAHHLAGLAAAARHHVALLTGQETRDELRHLGTVRPDRLAMLLVPYPCSQPPSH